MDYLLCFFLSMWVMLFINTVIKAWFITRLFLTKTRIDINLD